MPFLSLPHAPSFAVLAKCLLKLQFLLFFLSCTCFHCLPSGSFGKPPPHSLGSWGAAMLPTLWHCREQSHDQAGQSELPLLLALVILPSVSTVVSADPAPAAGSSSLLRPLPQTSLCCLAFRALHLSSVLNCSSSALTVSFLCLKAIGGDTLCSVNKVLSLPSAIQSWQDLAPAHLSSPGGSHSLSHAPNSQLWNMPCIFQLPSLWPGS